MKRQRRKPSFYVPAAFALTVVTTIHSVTAWAADDGGVTSAEAGTVNDDDEADGGKADAGDGGPDRTSCGATKDQGQRGGPILFGAGCC